MSTTLPSFNRTTSIVPPYRTNIPSHQHTAPPYRTTAPPYRTTVPYHISYQHTAPPYCTTVPYHHIIVPTHCTTVPYHLTTVPYHRTVPYIIVPTHRTYLTLPIQPESRLHLLWQFIIYNVHVHTYTIIYTYALHYVHPSCPFKAHFCARAKVPPVKRLYTATLKRLR